MVKEMLQWSIIVFYIEHTARLVVQTKLSPGENLEQLVQCAEPAKKGDETIRQLSHDSFSLAHGGHHVKLRRPWMARFPAHKRARGMTPITSPLSRPG